MEFLRDGYRVAWTELEERRFPGEEQPLGAIHAKESQNECLENNEEGDKRPEDTPFCPCEAAQHVCSISDHGGTRHTFCVGDPLPRAGVARVDGENAEKERPRFRAVPEREIDLAKVAERVDVSILQVQGAL